MRPSRPIYPLACALAALALAVPAAAAAGRSFPGSNPDESPRLNSPNDPLFDQCEPDDEDGQPSCGSPFSEQYQRFGFAPNGSATSARYLDQAQLSPARRAHNERAGRPADAQVSGISADAAWKLSTGNPTVDVAMVDTGIQWEKESLRRKVRLNQRELPPPQGEGCRDGSYDCDGDGALTVDDYARDPRVRKDAGQDVADKVLDGSDLIAAFSDHRDQDRNGYVDDIAGWDFFDNDNNPYDASSYSTGKNHGTGRMEEAGEEGNDGRGEIGVCPICRVVPLRDSDQIVHDSNRYAEAVLYAADNGIEVVGCACGGLQNSRFAREATAYGYLRGVFLALVSSDLNTADHNYPTNYNEGVYVAGATADTALFVDLALPGDSVLGRLGINGDRPIGTWFRNANITQYGGHAHIVLMGNTGSENTGQAAGAAGLLIGYSREVADRLPGKHGLRPGEVKQLLTLTAEDVLPGNTAGTGTADPARKGWDQHFGYGRVDLGAAMRAIRDGRIPPQVLITAPDWFEPLEVGRRPAAAVRARMSARTGSYRWTLEAAPGIEPAESEFQKLAEGSEPGEVDKRLARLDLRAIRERLDRRGGGGMNDPAAPAHRPGATDPNEPAFTIRVRVTDSAGVAGEDRRVAFAYRDPSLKPGWPRRVASGGEQSMRMYDLDPRAGQELVMANSSGSLRVLDRRGRPLRSFNNGRPVKTLPYANVHPKARGFRRIGSPREVFTTPAIGDIDGDGGPEIVAVAGEHIYAWHADGRRVRGWPVRVDPKLSAVPLRTFDNHIKRGFFGSVSLGDLRPGGGLEVVAGALDQHVYAFDGSGRPLPGFPSKLKSPGLAGAEIINTPASGDIAGDSRPEIVLPTNEVDTNAAPEGEADFYRQLLVNALAGATGGSGRIYAVDATGKPVPGWPVKQSGLLPDILPLVGPGIDHVLANLDSDPKLEVVGAITTGDVVIRDGDGSVIRTLEPTITGGDAADRTQALNVFEYPIVGDFDGGGDLEVLKGGVSLNTVANLALPGQNLPFNHLLQAWKAGSGATLPAYPKAHDDWQLLSSPALADVGADGGQEALVGSGLYLLHAYRPDGREPAGWPKFTGGWLFGVPVAGDFDGDGRVEVAAITREGFAFAWDSERPACPIGQWPGFRHDPRNDGNYATDATPPGPVAGLAVRGGRVVVGSAGDDGQCGKARAVLLKASERPIRTARDFRRAGALAGQRVPYGTGYVAAAAVDEAGNQGPIRVKRVR